MNHKNSLVLISLMALTGLVGCGGGSVSSSSSSVSSSSSFTPTLSKAEKALDSLRKRSHTVTMSQFVKITYTETTYVDLYIKRDYTMGFYYNGDEKAYTNEGQSYYADLDKTTGEAAYDYTITSAPETYFRGEDGYAYGEYLEVSNTLSKAIEVRQENSQEAVYSPITFDTEFQNPFDYISSRDVKENSDGSLSLTNETADFLTNCYNDVGLGKITDNTIVTDDNGSITSITFVVNDENGGTYIRHSGITISYTRLEDGAMPTLSPFTHDNPTLASALKCLDGKTNYTYYKNYLASDGTVSDHIGGYFTENCVYFHHHDSPSDTGGYTGGDDYDYKAVKEEDGIYHAYEYSESGSGFTWNVVKLTDSTNYTVDTFEGIAPALGSISASIFLKTGDYTYEAESYFNTFIGQYVDYSIYGPDSQVLETQCTHLKITLNEDGSIKEIETGYTMSGITAVITYTISNIGSTSLPSWLDEAEE